jgi:hemolysin activation/secretion protein
LQWVRRFGLRGYQFVSRLSAQRTDDALLPLEKFVVGGHNTVRGYRENELVRDNGHIVSVELHIPLFIGDSAISRWQLIPFADIGEAWEKSDFTPKPRSISSAGLALHWQPTKRWNANITWAHAFENIKRGNRESDIQDEGVNFNLSYQLY